MVNRAFLIRSFYVWIVFPFACWERESNCKSQSYIVLLLQGQLEKTATIIRNVYGLLSVIACWLVPGDWCQPRAHVLGGQQAPDTNQGIRTTNGIQSALGAVFYNWPYTSNIR